MGGKLLTIEYGDNNRISVAIEVKKYSRQYIDFFYDTNPYVFHPFMSVAPKYTSQHSLGQNSIIWSPKPSKVISLDTKIESNFLKCQFQAFKVFHLKIIPMTLFKDSMPYFNK